MDQMIEMMSEHQVAHLPELLDTPNQNLTRRICTYPIAPEVIFQGVTYLKALNQLEWI
jgi:hypothetical protein